MCCNMVESELLVVNSICKRLQKGRREYGELSLMAGRNWRQELREELMDALVYDAIDLLGGGK